jgi:hypothetical protein
MQNRNEIEILSENIRTISLRREAARRQRDICILELIQRLLQSNTECSPTELILQLRETLNGAEHSDFAHLLRAMTEDTASAKRLYEYGSFAVDYQTAPGAHGRIALVKNRYNEEAIEHFSGALIGAKHHYVTSFSIACEEVLSGRCEYAILPVENSSDGRLIGFYSMLDRYDLRICASCELETEERPGRVRYGLVGRKTPDRIPKESVWNLEFSVAEDDGSFPSDVIDVSRLFDAELLRVDSVSVSYDDGMQRYYFTFRVPDRCALAFDLYLSTLHEHYTPIGLYPILYP